MKTKLLRKCRRTVKFYERNGEYFVDTGNYMNPNGTKSKTDALKYYRFWILEVANRIFGFRPKRKHFNN